MPALQIWGSRDKFSAPTDKWRFTASESEAETLFLICGLHFDTKVNSDLHDSWCRLETKVLILDEMLEKLLL